MAAVQIHNIAPTEDKVGLKSNGLMLGQGMGLKKEPLVPIMIILGEIEMPQTFELCLLSKLDKQQRIDEIISNPVETFETVRKLKEENAALRAEVELLRSDKHNLYRSWSELRQQLAASQLEAKRLREALEASDNLLRDLPTVGGFYGLSVVENNEQALSSPTSTEALDAYVAEKVKDAIDSKVMPDDYIIQSEKLAAITRQRGLAISAATKARNAAQQCASVCSKHLDVYPALINMIDVVDEALAAIKESGATK